MSYYDPDLGKKVLTQDVEQVSQSTQKARAKRERKEKADYDAAVKEYEADQERFKKEQAELEKQQKEEISGRAAIEKKYDDLLKQLNTERESITVPTTRTVTEKRFDSETGWFNVSFEQPIDQDQQKVLYNIQAKRISEKEAQIKREKLAEINYFDYSQVYGHTPLQGSVRDAFEGSGGQVSLVELQRKFDEGAQAKAEHRAQSSIQTARTSPSYTKEQSAQIQAGYAGLLGTPTPEMKARADTIKPTPEKSPVLLGGGKQAEKTRPTLINVKTHETIYGGQKIEANPVAFVASLSRQNVDAAGVSLTVKKESPQSVFSFQNVSEVKDPSAIALLEFQSQLKTRTAPSATVYKGILEERGLPITPLSTRIIDTYSSKGLFRDYKGQKAAKGRKAIISQNGKQVFDIQTGMGDVNIGRKLGFVYDYNLQKPTTETPKTFEGSLQYVLAPKVQGPQQPKLEEAVAFPGSIETNLRQQLKPSEFGAEIQRSYAQLESESILLEKTPKSENPLLAAYQYVAPLGLAAGKSLTAMTAFGVNQLEQVQVPFYSKLLGLKQPKMVAPVYVGDASGIVALPVNFEKLDIRKPETYGASFQNPLEKEYQQKQLEYIKKYGATEYFSGLVFDYGGLKGSGSLIKTGAKSAPKLVSKISLPKRQLITIKGGVVSPSKSWDITEKIGLRKGITPPKTKTEFGKITTQQPVPNPFGKERTIPYNLQKAQKRITTSFETAKTKAVQIGGKVKTAIQKDSAFPNRSLVEGRNIEIPNVTRPAKPEFSKTLESARIGFGMKKQSLVKRLSEMENIYRGGIDAPSPYSRRLESLGIGLRIKRQEFTKGISSIGKKIPELKTPKGIIKIQKGLEKRKKAIIFIGKRTVKGIEAKRQNIIKSLSKLKPTIKAPYLPQKTSLDIARFKQKEKLDATLAKMRRVAISEEKPKAVVPSLSKNFLSRLKRGGISEPWDFKSIVKPFQKPNLRKEFTSAIRGSPIGKIKGVTSRKEFARLLTESETAPIASPLTKAKRNLLPEGSYDLQKKILLSDIGKIRRKGIDILERKEKTVKGLRGSFKTPDTELEILKGDLSRIGVKTTPKPFTPTYSIKDLPATSPDYNFRKMLKDVGVIRRKASDYVSFRKMETGALRGTLKTPDTKFELAKQDILKIKSKSERIVRLKSLGGLESPKQTIKPIFPVPRKPTELENILEGFKKEKKTGQPYKQVRIDKYVPKYPKSWEAWRGVGIVTASGTISALGLGSEKAEALPFATIGKIGAKQIESGGQILIFKESKDMSKIQKPFLVPPTLKEKQQEDEDSVLLAKIPSRQVLTVLPKVSFKFSTPQRVQESIKMKVIQPAKISFIQSTPQKTKQKTRPRQISKPKYETISLTRITPKLKAAQTPKLSSPLAPKAPTKLKAPQRQPLREKPKQITLLRERPPKTPRVIFGLPPGKEPPKKKDRREPKQVSGIYLGNVPETQISGIFKRKEITLGKEKIEKTRRGDVRILLGKKRETRRKKKDEYVLGFKVPKTKFF